MNFEDYNESFKRYEKQIAEKTEQMLSNYNELLTENSEKIHDLAMDPHFKFFSRNKKERVTFDVLYLPVYDESANTIYYDLSNEKLVWLSYDAELDFNSPTIIEDSVLQELFSDTEFYLDVIHFIGLNGILNSYLEYLTDTVSDLSEIN